MASRSVFDDTAGAQKLIQRAALAYAFDSEAALKGTIAPFRRVEGAGSRLPSSRSRSKSNRACLPTKRDRRSEATNFRGPFRLWSAILVGLPASIHSKFATDRPQNDAMFGSRSTNSRTIDPSLRS